VHREKPTIGNFIKIGLSVNKTNDFVCVLHKASPPLLQRVWR